LGGIPSRVNDIIGDAVHRSNPHERFDVILHVTDGDLHRAGGGVLPSGHQEHEAPEENGAET
jgi:hypothetical protein